ncbi:putative quinol monooxygenase [Rubritalea tangerina]|uniref:Quinol monooxygenase n=2 Tax=Rubritalea tangerina TaxID=430798 RepID=A0ABW4ZCI8_9BACT
MIAKKINLRAEVGCADALAALLVFMVEESKPEPGCVEYVLYQQKEEPEEFFLIEVWESGEHLEAHKQTAHFAQFKEKAPALVASKSSEELNHFL